jgi:enolase
MDSRIQTIHAREILDSRGNPTVEVDVTLSSGAQGRAAVPSGASTEVHEAVELRDRDPHRYAGKGVRQAGSHVNGALAAAIQRLDTLDQGQIDRALIAADGT